MDMLDARMRPCGWNARLFRGYYRPRLSKPRRAGRCASAPHGI